MNAEKRIKSEAKALLSKGNWSSSLCVFFILFASVLMVLFLQSFFVLGADVVLSPLFNALAKIEQIFSLEMEDSLANSIILLVGGSLGYIAYAIGFLFLFPLYCGVKRFFYLMTKGEEAKVSDLFYYFTKKLKGSLLLGLRYGLLCVVKFLPCIAPAYILFAVIMSGEFSPLANSLLTISVFVTGIAGFALWILWTSRQFLTIYLFIENDSLPSGVYIKESERILNYTLNKSVRKLFYSFGGWLLFALTGVGMLYFVPFSEASLATSAKWIIKLDKEVC